MHKEFAVDPNAVSSWERLLILSNCVGFEKGRVVVGCPAKIQWYRSVLKNLTTTEDKTNKIVEKLAHLFFEKKAVVTKEMSGWDSDEEWLLNVIREDEKLKGGLCDGIVTKEADPDRPKVVGFDSLDNENPVWRCVPGKAPRTSESIVKAARILLRYSSDIVLIDPYINPNRESYARPLRSLLDEIFSSSPRLKHDRHPVKRLECHISIHTDHSRSLCPDGVRSLYSDK